MENDPNMVGPQPWVGRMRHDAADARRLGCTGLLGIHWRTKVLAMNVSALALAAWDQSWAPGAEAEPEPAKAARTPEGPVGGKVAKFSAPVEGTEDDPVYQVVRYDVSGYNLDVPNGTYTVTIKLNEPHYGEAGKRVFGAKVQGRTAFKAVDIFARVGKNRALDMPLEGVRVTDGRLKIEFPRRTEFPCIAGIAVEGMRDAANQIAAGPYSRKINCAGGAWRGYEKGPAGSPGAAGGAGRNRSMPTEDFYLDFARASFGEAAAEPVGSLLAEIDGVQFPEHSKWQGGPGAVKVHNSSREDVARRYAFVDEFADLRPLVKGPGDLARFDYWLETLRYARSMAQVGACRGRLDAAVKALDAERDAVKRRKLAERALEIRTELAREWERMMTHQLAATDTPGELGTVANLEQHTRRRLKLLSAHDAKLAKALGGPLPTEVAPSGDYGGPARIIVPTVRSLVAPGEALSLKVILLAPAKVQAGGNPSGTLLWRALGAGEFSRVPLVHVDRAVHRAKLPPVPEGAIGIEYYLEARCGGDALVWPATAPGLCPTLVLLEPGNE
ncbi:MAG: malectin domain-containing carbohydrate-binding protein [Planctomycetota bacterium]